MKKYLYEHSRILSILLIFSFIIRVSFHFPSIIHWTLSVIQIGAFIALIYSFTYKDKRSHKGSHEG
ncbi:hypothetical protein R078131_01513 [Convivina intestini]|nr:hypothetical protein R078131_01513 [Convivina intestini]